MISDIVFLGFGLDAWITIVTVLGMFTVLLTTKWPYRQYCRAAVHTGRARP